MKTIINYSISLFLLFLLNNNLSAQNPSQATIDIQGFPDNGTLVKSKMCANAPVPCDGDCEWPGLQFSATMNDANGIKGTSAEVDGTAQTVTNAPPVNPPCPGPTNTTTTFTHNFAVTCPDALSSPKTQTFTIKFIESTCKPNTNDKVEFKKLELRCHKCPAGAGKTESNSNGNTYAPQNPVDQVLKIQFNLINIDAVPNTIHLLFTNPLGWPVSPAIPSTVTLNAGETIDYFLNVTVPGGTPAGTIDNLTLTSDIPGNPSSQSSATAQVIVTNPIPTLNQWGLIILSLILLTCGALFIWKSRSA